MGYWLLALFVCGSKWIAGSGAKRPRAGQAVADAFDCNCEGAVQRRGETVKQAVIYEIADAAVVPRFTVTIAGTKENALDATGLTRWVDGSDP
jgi:hypothetical protein